MQEEILNDKLQRLIDKDEIRDLMARYARGVDRADWDLVRDAYHTDATDDHGDYKGDIDGFIRFARDRTGGATQVMHFLGECLIEFANNDVAVVETYFFTAHTLGPEAQKQYRVSAGNAVQLSQYGRYVDRIERREGVWRIARRAVVFEATRLAIGEVPPLKPDWASQRRDRDDPIYQMRAAAGLR
jgi:SnoaL-like domain